jgi:hypothetical protein
MLPGAFEHTLEKDRVNMSESAKRGLDFAKKGFKAIYRMRVAEVKPGDSQNPNVVIFDCLDGCAEQYFKPGETLVAVFEPLADDDEPKAG